MTKARRTDREQSSHDRKVRQISRELKKEGYTVKEKKIIELSYY